MLLTQKITYLCNRFGHWGMLFYKYIQTYKKMCGVRCTPNLAAYCNNGLNLTSRGGGVIFKLLHKLLAKLQVSCYGITCKLPTCFQLCSTYYLLQLTYRARCLNSSALTAYYLLSPPPSVFVSISNFAMPYLFKTLQRYKDICNQPNILPKIFVFLTFYNK